MERLVGLEIRQLWGPDITDDFLRTIAALSDTGLSVSEAREVFRERLGPMFKTFVAVLDGRVVGTATLLVERKFLHKGSYAGHIEDVAVHPDFQRRGIGSALVAKLIEVAKDMKCYKVILDCSDHLISFYEKVGMRRASVQMRLDVHDSQ